MPTPKRRIPSLRLHKPTGQAVVRIDGHDFYLGKFGTAQADERYHRKIAEWLGQPLAIQPVEPAQQVSSAISISELILAYWRFVETYYVKNGRPTDEQWCIKAALRPLRRLYGSTPVVDFGPKGLKAVRQSMIDADLSRGVINGYIGRIRRMFRWAVEQELIPVTVYQALLAVRELAKGRTVARETRPILPVDDATVEATLPHLPDVVADMVRLQRLTGARPDEICIVRPCDVDTSGEVWLYTPDTHKTEHHDRSRMIFVGPQAQDVLRPYLLREGSSYCFSPCESEHERNVERRQARQSPMTPSQGSRRPRKNRRRPPGEHYTPDSYRRAIQRACELAWPALDGLTDDELKQWHKAHRWAPNRLRHSAGTEIRKRFGLEAAQVTLGHASADVTQVYAERDLELAAKVMQEVG